MVESDESPTMVRSVTRALRLLTALGPEGLSLTDAAARARIPLPTALRLMRTLDSESFAVRLENGNFVLGPAAVRLAYEADPEGPLRWAVRETVVRLRDRINETATCFVRRGSTAMCLESAESRHPVRWVSPRGERTALHTSAPGKVLLAYGPTHDLLAALSIDSGQFECAGGRVRRVEDLRQELADIRTGAPAIDDQESSMDVWGFALPFMVRGVCLGAFGFGMPLNRSRNNREDIISVCAEIVQELTNQLVVGELAIGEQSDETDGQPEAAAN